VKDVRISVFPEDDGMTTAIESAGGNVTNPEDANALVITWHPDQYGELARRLHPEIGWVQLGFAGIDGLFATKLIDDRRIWTGAQGAFAQPVAEYIVASVFALLREFPRLARETTWTGEVGRMLEDVTVGIVGGGGIGARAAEMLDRLGGNTVAVSRSGHPVPGTRWSGDSSALGRLLAESDIVVLALPLTAETLGLMGSAELAQMKPGASIVNVARGAVVDANALLAALDIGTLAAAILDVTDPEPLPDDHPLWHRENVLITPHTACSTEMSRLLMYERVSENLIRFANGERLLGQIDPGRGY
jgi:phosphoglycerate dehydrogenase-like enzyme